MKTKMYVKELNSIISNLFKNAELKYTDVTDTQYGFFNTHSNYIRVGVEGEWKDFIDFYEASKYANSRKGEFIVGVRPYKYQRAVVMATIKNN